jgi:malic enzyme
MQLYDQSKAVSLAAIAILGEATEEKVTFVRHIKMLFPLITLQEISSTSCFQLISLYLFPDFLGCCYITATIIASSWG